MRYRNIHILAGIFFILGMIVQIVASYRLTARQVQEQIETEMQLAQERLYFSLYDAYDVAVRLEDFIEEMDDPQELIEETRAIVKHYPHFYSCYVAYPENRFPQHGRWFCPCAYRKGDSITTMTFGDKTHDYFSREWYQGALKSDETGYWSHPYRDEDFDETIFTYSDDLRDKDGNLICVIASDFSVSWLHRLLERFKPFDEAVLALYSSNGDCLAISGEGLPQTNDRDWIVNRKELDLIDIELMIAVPKNYIWKSIRLSILLPFIVFLLGIIVVGIFIRRLWRDREESARLELMEHDLKIANQIQMGILRRDFPQNDLMQIHADLVPMREVGGDLYDFHIEHDDIWFIIGDVSGKGVPAAMFMSATVNLFRATRRRLHTPKQIMEEINFVLSDNNPSLTFVTAFIGRLNSRTGQLTYCNAGHCEPIVKGERLKVKGERLKVKGERLEREGEKFLECEPNIPLGYDGKYEFVEQQTIVPKGATLVLYTDGVTEARNAQHRMLGKKHWAETVARGGNLMEAVRRYIGEAEPTDDITLMTIKI